MVLIRAWLAFWTRSTFWCNVANAKKSVTNPVAQKILLRVLRMVRLPYSASIVVLTEHVFIVSKRGMLRDLLNGPIRRANSLDVKTAADAQCVTKRKHRRI